MSASGDIRPAGYAATAAEFLDAAAADSDAPDLAVRQLAAMQGIRWALLALGDQLADIATAVEDLHRAPLAGPVRGALDRVAWLRKGGLR